MDDYLLNQIKVILDQIDFSFFEHNQFCREFIEDEFLGSTLQQTLQSHGIQVKYGVSKLVFIPDQYNFVIKIPFTGTMNRSYDYSDSCDIEEDSYKYYDFINASCPITQTTSWDYCQSEAEYYQLARKEGLEQFFCKTKYFTTIGEIPIYISEKAINKEGIFKFTPKEKEKTRNTLRKLQIYDYLNININFLTALIKDYDMILIKKLINFLNINNIGDLHLGNIGIRPSNNLPVIIDYSDFWD